MKTWHIITSEYPPQAGGVSDYTSLLARALHQAGDNVNVWAPSVPDVSEERLEDGIVVHRTLGTFGAQNLAKAGEKLREIRLADCEVLVQWVPHGYGKRSMNVGFCRWVESLSHLGFQISAMVHEPGHELHKGPWRNRLIALVHRRMLRILLRSAHRVLISIPAWESYLRPYAPANLKFEWLPIPATIPVVSRKPADDSEIKVVGHLGTYASVMKAMLAPAISKLLETRPNSSFLLMGKGSEVFARALSARHPAIAARIKSTGQLSDAALSRSISSCDMMLQPFPDGLSSRRTSLMNALAHGVAVVSNLGHLSEDFWDSSKAVAITDPAHFVDTCIQLLDDATARKSIAEKGSQLYRSRFDWPNVVSTLRSSPESLPSGLSDRRSNSYSR